MCESFKEVCASLGGTHNADFCKTGGPFCTLGATLIGIPGKMCSSDGDCPMANEKKVCCSVYEDFWKAACTGIDSAKMEAMVTNKDPSQARA